MKFTGKAMYSTGMTLTGDVSDLVGIVKTPLLNALGDPMHEATSTYHEWFEDEILPNKDVVNDSTFTNPSSFVVDNGSRFRVGDQIQIEGSKELMLVIGISTNTLVVVRGYADTTAEDLADNQVINILGNGARFTNRIRCGNYTQIFTAAVELDNQKQARLRELVCDLENAVINGSGSMKGIIQHISTNIFHTDTLDETMINYALRKIRGNVDLIVVGQKINTLSQAYKIITTRWMPQNAALLLDSSRINVLPLAGRSFHFNPLSSEIIGEYTVELKYEAAHGLIR